MTKTRSQWWADAVTEFSGSWPFIIWFTALGAVWVLLNVSHLYVFDPYPFLFLNWVLTVVSTIQTPLIMLSQNRQNEIEKERVDEDRVNVQKLQDKLDMIMQKLELEV